MLKKKVLVYLDDTPLRDQIIMAFEGLFDLRVTPVFGLESILRSLDSSQFVASIFSTEVSGDEQVLANLKLLGISLPYSPKGGLRQLLLNSYQSLGRYYRKDATYCPIGAQNLDLLTRAQKSHPALFLRLPSNRYIKVHDGVGHFDQTRIDEYRERGVATFYLARTDFIAFLNRAFDSLGAELEQLANSSLQDQKESTMRVHLDVMNTCRISLARELRIPEHILDNASLLIDSLLKGGAFERPWFDRIEQNFASGQYIEKLGVLSAHFSCWIFTHGPYHDKRWLEKVVLSALVMDLSLKDEKSARVRDVQDGSTAVGMLQSMTIKGHPQRSLELAAKTMPLSPDIHSLVSHHHERFDGSGFPKRLYFNQIPSTSRLFILAHMFADQWLDNPDAASFRRYIDGLLSDEKLKGLHELLSKLRASLGEV